METKGNILFAGVGGQGILLASEVIAYSLLADGFDAKKSEVHGMAQRGGSVTAQLRYGLQVYSPLIEPGTADILISFEQMEAVRYLPYLHDSSKVIVNSQQIFPPAVASGQLEYPENVLSQISDNGVELIEVDAFGLAREAGEVKAANVVMVGVASHYLPLDPSRFVEVIETRIPERFREVNLKAFQAGRELIS